MLFSYSIHKSFRTSLLSKTYLRILGEVTLSALIFVDFEMYTISEIIKYVFTTINVIAYSSLGLVFYCHARL